MWTERRTIAIHQLEQRFGIAEMLSEQQENVFFASLLYYLGVLTLGEISEYGELTLKIPNLVVRKLYVEQLQKSYLPAKELNLARKVAKTLYSTGHIAPLCDFIEQRYFKVFDRFLVPRNDYREASELTIKTIFLTVLFNDTLYIMDSEKPLKRGYADLTMIVRPQMRKYKVLDILIEFKYIKLKAAKVTGEEARSMSRQQIEEPVKTMLTEATAQVKRYQLELEEKYYGILRLRAYVVLALGFDRVVWREVA